jgi:RNA polymerase sigma-70 factor (ECF subfamily)
MAVHTRRHTYDRRQPFTPWVFAIARNKYVDYLRRTKASMRIDPVEHVEEITAHEDHAAVESTIDLDTLLARLTPKARQAIQYVKLEGLSVKEAAARTGMSPSAIKVSVHRGLKALARAMRDEGAS